jgi:molybdopterin-guanine dinucleotide biosynthesis protein A
MGGDKAGQTLGGIALAEWVARAMLAVADPVWVVGPHSVLGLDVVNDTGKGPLVALVSGWERMLAQGREQSVLLVPCDLPFVTPELLAFLADNLNDADAVCPVSEGKDQPLAACYAAAALRRAQRLVDKGEDSMRALLAAINVRRIPESEWRAVAPARALMDVDTPEELEAARRIVRVEY